MAKTAVMIRLSDTELATLDARAVDLGISRAAVAMLALRTYLERPSLLESPMREDGPLPPAPKGALRARVQSGHGEPAPAPPEIHALKEQLRATGTAYRIDTSNCQHKYRDRHGTCLGCGHNR